MITTLSIEPGARQPVPASVIAVASWITPPIPHTSPGAVPSMVRLPGRVPAKGCQASGCALRGLRGSKCLVQKAVTRQMGRPPTFGGALGS